MHPRRSLPTTALFWFDEPRPTRVTSASEFLERYAAGERDFRFARLRGADLSGANLSYADLRHADFSSADLSGANLRGVELTGAALDGVNLRGADLDSATLDHTNLSGADLTRACLANSHLGLVVLEATNLSGTDLRRAALHGVWLNNSNCANVLMGMTTLWSVPLVNLCSADPPVRHDFPSGVDHRSIVESIKAPGLRAFLVQCGMPEVFAEHMIDCARSLDPRGIFSMFQSTFISYGGGDEPFARKLYEALHRNGVTTFFFVEHAVPGEKLHRTMRNGVARHDRVILICSKNSLDRRGVMNEIEEALTLEAEHGGEELLIPITLDNHIFETWQPKDPGMARAIKSRVVADFRGASEDATLFQRGLARLLSALKKRPNQSLDRHERERSRPR